MHDKMNQSASKYTLVLLFIGFISLQSVSVFSQVVVGGETPDPSAALDIQGAGMGFLFPKLTTAERNAISSPATGLIIYNTTTLCLEVNTGTPSSPEWVRSSCKPGVVSSLNCAGSTFTGTLMRDANTSGASLSVPYTGGNGYWFIGQSVTSTGVTGLTATAQPVLLANGSGSITYNITGTPASLGTATFALSAGGQTCNVSLSVTSFLGLASTVSCSGATLTGTLWSGVPASSVSVSVPYTGGNGGAYPAQTISSTGVTGLTATIAAGTLANGSGSLVYTISGTPASGGTATFPLNVGGRTCNVTVSVGTATVTALNCSSMTMSNVIQSGQAVSGVTVSVPYTGGNGGAFSSQTVTSTGVTGLTATLSAGNFAVGAGTLSYALTGTPSASGTASFALSIGGQTCTLNVRTGCGAYVAAGTWKEFSCYNLGSANTSADPLTPSWEINGGYWQWGRAAQAAAGPSGSGSGQTNSTVTYWNATDAPNGSWIDAAKTGNDPCPVGLRVPTDAQWTGVSTSNTISSLGTWTNTSTNYTAGKMVGSQLMLPAAGQRNNLTGNLENRGNIGYYWSSKESSGSSLYGFNLFFSSTSLSPSYQVRGYGASVRCIADVAATVTALNCAGATVTGTLVSGASAGSVSASVPYTGGNGGFHNGQTVTSTGVTGLTATLAAGNVVSGSGSLTYTITGTPASTGTATFALSVGGQTCNLTATVVAPAVSALNCSSMTMSNVIQSGQAVSGVTVSVPYTGGNGGPFSSQTVTSTGVTGLTATLSAGNFAVGAGSLSYALTGTPSASGTASFALSIGGQTCTLNVRTGCGAFIAAGTWREFSCYNLGSANTSANPFTPSWEINGGYWQWGRVAQAAAGPTGPGAGQANDGNVTGWNNSDPGSGRLLDAAKTANDPCPVGYRIPTNTQWTGVVNNNTPVALGTWTNSSTNYSAGKMVGGQLMLPPAGNRQNVYGNLDQRGNYGYYWSSTDAAGYTQYANILIVNPGGTGSLTTSLNTREYGHSVRCIADVAATVTALNCAGATVTGNLLSGINALNVSVSVPYTGGNGGFHNGQTVTSTGVTGLTATLAAGNVEAGSGSLTYTITGTPASTGTATFALSVGGQTCNLTVTVSTCSAKVSATETKIFSCYNLGAANTSADPFTPSWEINGGYWQWGRVAQAAAGPTGPGSGQTNEGVVAGWNTTPATDGSLADGYKTVNDPCPSGFRLPTKAQWDGVRQYNTITTLGGTWNSLATRYENGKKFGNNLMLPAAGDRAVVDGSLSNRGNSGTYWSSTGSTSDYAGYLYFAFASVNTFDNTRRYGFSVRCIADVAGTVSSLNCSSASTSGLIRTGQNNSGITVSVPYTGGNGGYFDGQTITSTGITGLTATLSGGNFVSGSGSLSFAITGTPSGIGAATFALTIGGQSCSFVTYTGCGAFTAPGIWKEFACYNLGAANTSADPMTPSWEINGGYWQWGRLAQAAAGPTGSDAATANAGVVSGWDPTGASDNGSWLESSKTANDPCPSGYRVPTLLTLGGLFSNNTVTNTGSSWVQGSTNYSTGKKIGHALFLPAAGARSTGDGSLGERGSSGNYWSPTSGAGTNQIYFTSGSFSYLTQNRAYGASIRCIAE